MKPLQCLAVLVLLAALSACSGSPQVRFHTLTPPPGVDGDTDTAAAVSASRIRLLGVSVPPQVDRRELVVRDGESQLRVLSADWWSASLAGEIQSSLEARFANGDPRGKAVSARVDVIRFDTVPNGHAWLEARYRLESESRDSLACMARFRTVTSNSVSDLVRAQQQNLGRLADEMMLMAEDLDGDSRCP